MKLIAFVGSKGSGKDTCAAIAKEAGLVQGKISFAGPLKRICAEAFGYPLELFEHAELKEDERLARSLSFDRLVAIAFGMRKYIWMSDEQLTGFVYDSREHIGTPLLSPRHVLQYVGTEIIRAYQPSWHLEAAFSTAHLYEIGYQMFSTYAVTDCRFLNEYEFLKERGAHFIYVSRPEAEARLAQATHESERQILEIKKRIGTTIFNNGTIEGLKDVLLGDEELLEVCQ